jgi:6-phosphogluconolactonase
VRGEDVQVTLRPDFKITDDPAAEACRLLTGAGGHVVITGGSTPRSAYERAAERRANWVGVEIWFTDERCVPPEHEHSNYGMAERALFSKVEGLKVHRMQGELGPQDGAREYERELEESGPEAFDLMLLGLGPDAHICSLFPNDDALGERARKVVGVETPGMAPLLPRITLTLPVVNATSRIVFLVTGEDKAEAVARAFSGRPDPRAPGSLVDGEVTVLLDSGAASRL